MPRTLASRRSCTKTLGALPVLRQVLRRIMDAVEDLDGAGLRRRLARRAGAEDAGQVRPARVGLDGGTDADEAAALLEVRLEVRALRVGQRARHARVQEHDGAVRIKVRGRELRADISGRGCGDGAVAPTAAVMAAMPAVLTRVLVLVTTSTLYGSAACGLGAAADAVAGRTRARLARARPRLLLPIKYSSLTLTRVTSPLSTDEGHSRCESSPPERRASSQSL